MVMVDLSCSVVFIVVLFFFKQKTAYEMRISDWSSDVCSSDLDAVTDRRYPDIGEAGQLHRAVQFVDQLLRRHPRPPLVARFELDGCLEHLQRREIGRASGRERVCKYV